jgi:hypothetical protein
VSRRFSHGHGPPIVSRLGYGQIDIAATTKRNKPGLYWNQSCTRKQADQIFLRAMIENKVDALQQKAIHGAARGVT